MDNNLKEFNVQNTINAIQFENLKTCLSRNYNSKEGRISRQSKSHEQKVLRKLGNTWFQFSSKLPEYHETLQ